MAQIMQIDSHTWRFEDEFVRFFLLDIYNGCLRFLYGIEIDI